MQPDYGTYHRQMKLLDRHESDFLNHRANLKESVRFAARIPRGTKR